MNPSNQYPKSVPPFRDYYFTKGGKQDITARPAKGSVGIVIPVKNGIKFLKLCFYSVLDFTDHPYLVMFVDNQSDLDVRREFYTMHNNHPLYIERYDDDFNFSAEVNLGLKKMFSFPEVEYGLILNADTVVTPGYMSSMISVMTSDPKMGAVGPRTNVAIPEQTSLDPCEPYPTTRLSGFCMLIRRQTFEEVDGFDEQFVGGGYEDWDFCERIRQIGWKVAIDGHTYIHHFYKQFRKNDHDGTMKENQERFFKKHPLLYDLVKP